MPKISVCIPTYNRADLLRRCIDSVVAQDWTDWELIITDNASSDNTTEVVASYRDSRVRSVRQSENIGMFKNFNAAIREAKGEYVKMLMDDDVLLPACLRRQIEILDQFPKVNFVCSDYSAIDADSKPIQNIYFHHDSYRVFRESREEAGSSFILEYLLGHRVVGLPSAITFRRLAAEKVGYFDEQIGNPLDADMWLRLAATGDFYYLDEKLLYVRWHDNWSKQFTAGSFGYRDVFDLTQKHYALRSSWPEIQKHRHQIYQRLINLIIPYYIRANLTDREIVRKDFAKMPLSTLERLVLRLRLALWPLIHAGRQPAKATP